MVFSDGVWFDPADRLFKMWYMAGYWGPLAYAFSEDGIRWTKPRLDVVAGTNIVLDTPRGSTTVWLDRETADPKRRFVLFRQRPTDPPTFSLHYSPDGIHWGEEATRSGPGKDRSTLFYNPFRKMWVFSLKDMGPNGRWRRYRENRDAAAGMDWNLPGPTPWVSADRLDPQRGELGKACQLYNLDAAPYESLMLGLFSIWRGQPADRPKPNEVVAAYSRDGFHWHRPLRKALVPVSEHYGDWNWGNVQSAGGCCVPVGDKLYFYVSGRAGVRGSKDSGVCTHGARHPPPATGSPSMRAGGRAGTLTTRLLRFKGARLFVNTAAPEGELRVEALDRDGRVIEPFSRGACLPVRADSTASRDPLEEIRRHWRARQPRGALPVPSPPGGPFSPSGPSECPPRTALKDSCSSSPSNSGQSRSGRKRALRPRADHDEDEHQRKLQQLEHDQTGQPGHPRQPDRNLPPAHEIGTDEQHGGERAEPGEHTDAHQQTRPEDLAVDEESAQPVQHQVDQIHVRPAALAAPAGYRNRVEQDAGTDHGGRVVVPHLRNHRQPGHAPGRQDAEVADLHRGAREHAMQPPVGLIEGLEPQPFHAPGARRKHGLLATQRLKARQ